MKIKVSDKHNAIITLYVCKSNDDKPYGSDECERLYNDLVSSGKSLYHHADFKEGYRIRIFKLDDYIYLTTALQYPDEPNERVMIQEFESKHEKDAIAIAKFFRRNYHKLLEQGRDARNIVSHQA